KTQIKHRLHGNLFFIYFLFPSVEFSGIGLIKYILPGLVLLCFAVCASCYTRSPHPSWLHVHPPHRQGRCHGTGKAAMEFTWPFPLPGLLPGLDLQEKLGLSAKIPVCVCVCF
uniref:Uncharacterized protein n=1 Tax=Junco hyemalis TaxID=40217 RepID=A0A8C5NIT5_JUNHY